MRPDRRAGKSWNTHGDGRSENLGKRSTDFSDSIVTTTNFPFGRALSNDVQAIAGGDLRRPAAYKIIDDPASMV
jgi:hypothetical protein